MLKRKLILPLFQPFSFEKNLTEPFNLFLIIALQDYQHGGSLPSGSVVKRRVTTMEEEVVIPDANEARPDHILQISSGSGDDAVEAHCIVTMPPSLDDSDVTQTKQYLNEIDDSAIRPEMVSLLQTEGGCKPLSYLSKTTPIVYRLNKIYDNIFF